MSVKRGTFYMRAWIVQGTGLEICWPSGSNLLKEIHLKTTEPSYVEVSNQGIKKKIFSRRNTEKKIRFRALVNNIWVSNLTHDKWCVKFKETFPKTD